MYQRIAVIRARLTVPNEPVFGLSGVAAYDNSVPVGHLFAGPPAYTDQTDYFEGNFVSHETSPDGIRMFFVGTFGPKILSDREPANLTVTLKNGLYSLSGAYNVPFDPMT